MATPLTRQDMLAITEGAKNKIIDRLVTRNELQGAADNARDRLMNTINAFHVETQTLIRQNGNQNEQINRRIVNLESQMTSLRQDVRSLMQSINSMGEQHSQQFNRLRASEYSEN